MVAFGCSRLRVLLFVDGLCTHGIVVCVLETVSVVSGPGRGRDSPRQRGRGGVDAEQPVDRTILL